MRKLAVLLGIFTLSILLSGVIGCTSPTATPTAPATPTATPTPSAVGAINKISPTVVRITSKGSSGPGVVVDKAGYILTSNTLVEGSQTVSVFLSDGRQLQASVLGRDEMKNLAIVKISADGLSQASMGQSGQLKLGDEVMAIGFPPGGGDSPSVSKGIVSALRNIDNTTYLQIDATVGPGYVGAPLINLGGELVGVCSDKSEAGKNLAVAIDSATPAIPAMVAGASFLRPTPPPTVTPPPTPVPPTATSVPPTATKVPPTAIPPTPTPAPVQVRPAPFNIGTDSGSKTVYLNSGQRVEGSFSVAGSDVTFSVSDPGGNTVLQKPQKASLGSFAFVAAQTGNYSLKFVSSGIITPSVITLEYTIYWK